jgi:hypothetical protein
VKTGRSAVAHDWRHRQFTIAARADHLTRAALAAAGRAERRRQQGDELIEQRGSDPNIVSARR